MMAGSDRMLEIATLVWVNIRWRAQNHLLSITIGTALEIAEENLAFGIVVREVTQCLHGLGPFVACMWGPSAIAIEFLEVLDHGFDEMLMPRLYIFPDIWPVQENLYAICNYSSIGEVVHNLLSTAYDFHFFREVMVLID
jgi:hypothetical protein